MKENKSQFYDGTKLLSLKDLRGERPEIYICTSNRSAGKTTFFNKLCVNKFIKNQEKFLLLYRFNYELDDVAEKFFKDIQTLFFPGYNMESEKRSKGLYHELFLIDSKDEKTSCGYAVALNSSDQIKRYSHFFSDVQRIIFDEFQSEVGHYCNNEVKKFISLHTSVSRGSGKQSRYVPVYMISNPVSIVNPYYIELGISERLSKDTHFLRGVGFVLEQGHNKAAADALQGSAFNKAFENNDYMDYNTQGVYLNDNLAFIEKPTGSGKYLATIRYKNKDFAIRQFKDLSIMYCDKNVDHSFPFKISVTTPDHNINYVMLRNNDIFISNMRFYFNKGCFRFKDLECKEAIIKLIG